MKKIILSILAIVVLVIAVTIFWVIRSFNADNYKEQVVQTLQEITGRTVQVEGEVSLSWKPLPTFVMNQLVVSNAPTSKNPTMATIDQVQVEIEWASFFKSPLVIKRIILKKPEILVERQHSYQTNFFFPILFNPNRTNEQESVFSSSLSGTAIDTLEIDSGILKWENALTGEKFTLNNISGTGKIKSLDGPYSFNGSFKLLDQDFNLNLQTDKLLVASPLQVTLQAENTDSQTSFQAVAILDFEEDEQKWLNLSGSYLSKKPQLLFKKMGFKNWPAAGVLSGSYKVDILPKQTQFKDIILSQKDGDKTLLSAKLNLTKDAAGKALLSLMADTLDLTQMNRTLLTLMPAQQIDLDIQISKAFWHKMVFQPLSLKGSTNQGVLNFQLGAALPQDGAISLKGDYHFDQKDLTGDFSCTLSDALAWAYDVFDKKYLPQNNAKKLTLMGKVSANAQQQNLDIQLGSLDSFEFTGKITHTQQGLQTDLIVKNLNLDDYYTLPNDYLLNLYQWMMTPSETPVSFMDVASVWNIELNNFTLNRLVFPLVYLKGKVDQDKITLTDITVKKNEENILSLSGDIEKPATEDVSFNKLMIHLLTQDVKQWFLGGIQFQWLQDNVEDLQADIIYTGNLQQGVLQSSLSSSGREISTDGKVENLGTHPIFYQNKVHFVYPNLAHFIKLLFPETDFDSLPLPVDFTGEVTWTPDNVSFNQSNLKLGRDVWQFSAQYNSENSHLSLDLNADNINLDLFLRDLKAYWQNPQMPFKLNVIPKLSLDIIAQAEQMRLNKTLFKDFKTQISLANNKMDVKEFTFSSGQTSGLFDVRGHINFDEIPLLEGYLRIENMPLPEDVFNWDKYYLGQGLISLKSAFALKGNNVQTLFESLDVTTPFVWNGAVLTGVNLGNLKNDTMNAIQMIEVPENFNARLDNDFQNGRTPLPLLKGQLTIKQGLLSLSSVQGVNDMVDVSGLKLDDVGLTQTGQLEIPFVLKLNQNLPAVIFTLSAQGGIVNSANFMGGLTDVIKILSTKNLELKQQKVRQEKEQKNAQMRQSSEQILNQTETLLKILQEKVSLNPSEQADEKMTQLTKAVQDIRHLAVKPNLSDGEYMSLVGKTKMLAEQAKDFNNWFGVSDLMNRKEETIERAKNSTALLNQMEKIYQQNARSVLMAELIVNARQVVQNIEQDAEKLKVSKDKSELVQLMDRLDANELKIQKAYDYMKKTTLSENR